LENIPPGKYSAAVKLKDRKCSFTLKVPYSRDMVHDLGEVTCEIP